MPEASVYPKSMRMGPSSPKVPIWGLLFKAICMYIIYIYIYIYMYVCFLIVWVHRHIYSVNPQILLLGPVCKEALECAVFGFGAQDRKDAYKA